MSGILSEKKKNLDPMQNFQRLLDVQDFQTLVISHPSEITGHLVFFQQKESWKTIQRCENSWMSRVQKFLDFEFWDFQTLCPILLKLLDIWYFQTEVCAWSCFAILLIIFNGYSFLLLTCSCRTYVCVL